MCLVLNLALLEALVSLFVVDGLSRLQPSLKEAFQG